MVRTGDIGGLPLPPGRELDASSGRTTGGRREKKAQRIAAESPSRHFEPRITRPVLMVYEFIKCAWEQKLMVQVI